MPSPKLRYFAYEHLPPTLQTISKPIGDLARQLDTMLPDGSQKELGMQSLLDAKDRFVRAALPPEPNYPLATDGTSKAPPSNPNTLAGTRHG